MISCANHEILVEIDLQCIPTYSGKSIADITDFYKGILDKIHFELPMYSGFFVFL